MTIWLILLPFVIFYGSMYSVCHLLYFSHFGMFGPRKIWQPWLAQNHFKSMGCNLKPSTASVFSRLCLTFWKTWVIASFAVSSRVARCFQVQHTKTGKNNIKMPTNLPNCQNICIPNCRTNSKRPWNIPTFSVHRPSTIIPKLGLRVLKSGNPAPSLTNHGSIEIRGCKIS
jgi:hypothetical protein